MNKTNEALIEIRERIVVAERDVSDIENTITEKQRELKTLKNQTQLLTQIGHNLELALDALIASTNSSDGELDATSKIQPSDLTEFRGS